MRVRFTAALGFVLRQLAGDLSAPMGDAFGLLRQAHVFELHVVALLLRGLGILAQLVELAPGMLELRLCFYHERASGGEAVLEPVAAAAEIFDFPLARKNTVYGFLRVAYQWEVYARTTTQGGAFFVTATFLQKPLNLPTK